MVELLTESILLVIRCVFSYILAIFVFRLMGKREMAELSVFDVIIFLMMAESISLGIKEEESMWTTVVVLFTLAVLQKIMAIISKKNNAFQRLVEGVPNVIVRHGYMEINEMREVNFNVYDLVKELRQQGVSDLRDVDFAVLEVDGKLSVFQKENNRGGNQSQTTKFTLPLVIDGEVQYYNLKMLNLTPKWLYEELAEQNYDSTDKMMYCSYRDKTFYVQYQDDISDN